MTFESRREIAARAGRMTKHVGRLLEMRLSLRDLSEIWQETGDMLLYVAEANNFSFPNSPPLTPDDHPALRLLVKQRIAIRDRGRQILKSRAKRRRRQ
jgi:hypothetical protein